MSRRLTAEVRSALSDSHTARWPSFNVGTFGAEHPTAILKSKAIATNL
jgi:hypothetical protein